MAPCLYPTQSFLLPFRLLFRRSENAQEQGVVVSDTSSSVTSLLNACVTEKSLVDWTKCSIYMAASINSDALYGAAEKSNCSHDRDASLRVEPEDAYVESETFGHSSTVCLAWSSRVVICGDCSWSMPDQSKVHDGTRSEYLQPIQRRACIRPSFDLRTTFLIERIQQHICGKSCRTTVSLKKTIT